MQRVLAWHYAFWSLSVLLPRRRKSASKFGGAWSAVTRWNVRVPWLKA